MDSLRKTAFVAGAFYLITFVSSIPALGLLGPVLNNPDYIISSGADTRVLLGGSLDLINALAAIGTAVALFAVVKRQNEAVALGFVASRLLEAAVIVVGVVSIFSVVTLRQDLAGATGADAASLVTTGQSLVAIRDWTFLLGPGLMAGINALLLGYLMYRSRLVPRVIPVLGLIGAPLHLASVTATLFGINEQVSVWSAIAVAPIFVWELLGPLRKHLRPRGVATPPNTNGAQRLAGRGPPQPRQGGIVSARFGDRSRTLIALNSVHGDWAVEEASGAEAALDLPGEPCSGVTMPTSAPTIAASMVANASGAGIPTRIIHAHTMTPITRYNASDATMITYSHSCTPRILDGVFMCLPLSYGGQLVTTTAGRSLRPIGADPRAL